MPIASHSHNSIPATVIIAARHTGEDGETIRCLVREWPACEGCHPELTPPATPEVVSIGANEVRPIQRQLRLLVERNGHWISTLVDTDLDMVTVRNLLIWSGVRCTVNVLRAESAEIVEIAFGSRAADDNPSMEELPPAPTTYEDRNWAAKEEQRCRT